MLNREQLLSAKTVENGSLATYSDFTSTKDNITKLTHTFTVWNKTIVNVAGDAP